MSNKKGLIIFWGIKPNIYKLIINWAWLFLQTWDTRATLGEIVVEILCLCIEWLVYLPDCPSLPWVDLTLVTRYHFVIARSAATQVDHYHPHYQEYHCLQCYHGTMVSQVRLYDDGVHLSSCQTLVSPYLTTFLCRYAQKSKAFSLRDAIVIDVCFWKWKTDNLN